MTVATPPLTSRRALAAVLAVFVALVALVALALLLPTIRQDAPAAAGAAVFWPLRAR